MSTIKLAALAALSLLTGFSARAQAQEAVHLPTANTVTVTGSGEAHAAPDVAYVTVGVQTEARRAQEAAQANAAATQKVIAAVRQQGIAERDIQTSNYGVNPRYDNRPNGSVSIVGYQVTNQVRATVRKLGSVGAVIDAALDSGANVISGVSFGLENHARPEADALAAAVADARHKADTLARAAGLHVVGVLYIQEGLSARPVPILARGMAMNAASATPVEPGEMNVAASVTIAFTLAQGAATTGERPTLRSAAAGSKGH